MIFDALRRKSTDFRIVSSKQLAELIAGGGSSSGVSVTPQTAMAHAAVFACVRVLAESAGQLPLQVYRRSGRERLKAEDHALYKLLHWEPNAYQTAQEFVECVVAHLALRGNFYGYLNRGSLGGEVREILPLNPGCVTPVLSDTYELAYKVRYSSGKEDVLPPSSVLHIRLFSLDGITGLSPITQARESIGLSMATEKHGARLFSNGARPGGVLSTPKVLSPEASKRMREDWTLRHEGVENAHRIAILEEGLAWTQTGLSSEDSQFLETRKYQRSEIAGVFRVPPHMIGDLDKATFSNIEHQGLEFVTNGLMPYLTRIEGRVSKQLVSEEERATVYAKFSVQALLRGDMKTRAAYYQTLEQCGALSPNEIREYEDLNPREGGDVYLTPMNMASTGDAPDPADPAAPPADAPDTGKAVAEGIVTAAKEIADALRARPAPTAAKKLSLVRDPKTGVVSGATVREG